MFRIIGLCLALTVVTSARASDPAPLATASATSLNSFEDFERYMVLHVRRTRALLLAAAELPEYHELSRELVDRFSAIHDQSKLNRTIEFLKRHHLDGRRETILQSLYRLRGQNGAAIAQVAKELNTVDRQEAHRFFAHEGLITPQGRLTAKARRLLEIEKVADLTDRGLAPGTSEEFGRTMKRASIWFNEIALSKSRTLANALGATAEDAVSAIDALPKPPFRNYDAAKAALENERALARRANWSLGELRVVRTEVEEARRMAVASATLEAKYSELVQGLEFHVMPKNACLPGAVLRFLD